MVTEDAPASSGFPRINTVWIVLIFALMIVGASIVVRGLLVVRAVRRQERAAWEAQIQIEREQLRTALQEYRQRYGSFPPTEPNLLPLRAHLRRNFPRYQGDLEADLADLQLDVADMDASEALVFWLGGLREQAVGTRLLGFGRNPTNPFDMASATEGPLYAFDSQRLVDTDNDHWLEYVTPSRQQQQGTFELQPEGKVRVTGVALPNQP